MSKTKQGYLNDLAIASFHLDNKVEQIHARTREMQKMASLARQGKKDSQEFRDLQGIYRSPSVIPLDDEVKAICKIAKRLRKYKF